jgi:Mg2+-importing ATPase
VPFDQSSETFRDFRNFFQGFHGAGFNTIAIAIKEFKGTTSTQSDERGLTLVGFLTFLDPPRESAKTSIDQLERLGVAVKVLSGDDPLVTRAVCKQVGLTIVGGMVSYHKW